MNSKTEWVYHGRRFWVQEPKGKQHRGWNTDFEPCIVTHKTAKRVQILSPTFGVMYLNREKFERDGRVYHSKVHEYFYAIRPSVDPEQKYSGWQQFQSQTPVVSDAFTVLGLSSNCSRDDIKRAYKRLAKKHHPDAGGSHTAFIELKNAYETALSYF